MRLKPLVVGISAYAIFVQPAFSDITRIRNGQMAVNCEGRFSNEITYRSTSSSPSITNGKLENIVGLVDVAANPPDPTIPATPALGSTVITGALANPCAVGGGSVTFTLNGAVQTNVVVPRIFLQGVAQQPANPIRRDETGAFTYRIVFTPCGGLAGNAALSVRASGNIEGARVRPATVNLAAAPTTVTVTGKIVREGDGFGLVTVSAVHAGRECAVPTARIEW